MKNFTPDGLIQRNLERACELLALSMVTSGTNEEINSFSQTLHERLDYCIDHVLQDMEQKMKINESLKNPKIAK